MILKLDLGLLVGLISVGIIFALLIVAAVIAFVKRIKMARKYNHKKAGSFDTELKAALIDAFGNDNIESVQVEMSRLTITVKDIDLVNADLLKELGANGVLLMGNKVKCSFGEKAKEIYELLK